MLKLNTIALWFAMLPAVFAETGLLMRTPTVNRYQIVFSYTGDLWSVPREGGNALVATSHRLGKERRNNGMHWTALRSAADAERYVRN